MYDHQRHKVRLVKRRHLGYYKYFERRMEVMTETLFCFSWTNEVAFNLEQSLYNGHGFRCQGTDSCLVKAMLSLE